MKQTFPNPEKQTYTIGVEQFLHEIDTDLNRRYFYLAVLEAYDKQPDQDFDGGNDKEFFSFEYQGKRFFAARNEINGLTIMLPDEY